MAPTSVAPRPAFRVPLPGGRVLDLGSRTLVMGILNVTPDSFADGAPLTDPGAAIEAALRMEAEGADLVDVGGESTRPGAGPVPADEEARRVLPVIRELALRLRVPVSVDTYKAAVARAAVGEGASLVNDISGLRYDPGLGEAVAATGAALVLMHTRGRSRDMYREAVYEALPGEVIGELEESVRKAVAAGVDVSRIIIDPGFGFAKKAEHSYRLLASIGSFGAIGRPILVGLSRKSFLAGALGGAPPSARDWGTAAAVTAAVLGGAHIVRVHDVAGMADVTRVADEIRRHAGRPDGAAANGQVTGA